MNIAALIVAAGSGTRAGTGAHPKQYQPIGGKIVLQRTLDVFMANGAVSHIMCVINPVHAELYASAVSGDQGAKLLEPAMGGETRQASVRAGLEALRDTDPDVVLVHDAARPFTSQTIITNVIAALADAEGAIPAIPVTDTLKRAGRNDRIVETLPRQGLYAAQTPQGFRYRALLTAHDAAHHSGVTDLTDDAAIAEWRGLDVQLVPGDPANTKLTTSEDLRMADERLTVTGGNPIHETRTATGFDVHRLGPGAHIYLCGLKIPHDKTLIGHSDADVGAHALTDALLGTIGDGDIGTHFPPSDPKWKGAASDQFLADAGRRIRQRSGTIVHIDVTLICEQPKIGLHREAMRERLAEILGIQAARVSVKATTSEGLGFTGRSEGIAALATATVRLPVQA